MPICNQIGFVIPTRNRRRELARLLESLALQSCVKSRVVVVASGGDVRDLIGLYQERLNISHVFSDVPGQIYQRNIGISILISGGYDYIGFLDDDVALADGAIDALNRMIRKKIDAGEWNFGVGLNILNYPGIKANRYYWLQRVLDRVGKSPGSITRSGMNTAIANIEQDIKTSWLGGGYTVWAASILLQFPQQPCKESYAGAEDLLFSYPIGKSYGLYVCAEAGIFIEENIDTDTNVIAKKAEAITKARLRFCAQYPEFSVGFSIFFNMIYYLLILFMPGRLSRYESYGFIRGVYSHMMQKGQT
jgi:glycosyltransferase involved in cell wall biosynthesis